MFYIKYCIVQLVAHEFYCKLLIFLRCVVVKIFIVPQAFRQPWPQAPQKNLPAL